MKVVIVGAGLGGLASALALSADGHELTVLDSAPQFGEVGAGIRVPPNSSRLLQRWGVNMSNIKKSKSERYHFVRWKDGSTIAEFSFGGDAEDTYGSPYYLVHRADLHKGLLEAAERVGVKVLPNHEVIEYNMDEPYVKTKDGTTFRGDLVIAADGIKSLARSTFLGKQEQPRDTGDVAYRILIDGKKMREDPELAGLLDHPCTTSWCGPEAHLVGYPIRNEELYNIVVCATCRENDFKPGDGWVTEGTRNEFVERFASWCPQVTKLTKLSPNFLKWKLFDLPVLERWVSDTGKGCLLGDSCHPMLPYLAQGAAQCFEDAATLATCIREESDMKSALKKYEKLRIPRTAVIQENTRKHQYILHIDDGEQQRARDLELKKNGASNPVFWGDSDRRQWLFGYDAEKVAKQGIDSMPSSLIKVE
uniref:ARAD1D27984p n=1 Tax=Blastobotrys adeninivorans TaxID=409370 RepID=A0A060TH41_BLAAD